MDFEEYYKKRAEDLWDTELKDETQVDEEVKKLKEQLAMYQEELGGTTAKPDVWFTTTDGNAGGFSIDYPSYWIDENGNVIDSPENDSPEDDGIAVGNQGYNIGETTWAVSSDPKVDALIKIVKLLIEESHMPLVSKDKFKDLLLELESLESVFGAFEDADVKEEKKKQHLEEELFEI